MTPCLLNMPEDVMIEIMKDFGIKEIMTLRKVCHDLRNFTDDVKPGANLERIEINGGCNKSIFVRYQFSKEFCSVTYEEHVEGCLVKNRDRGIGIRLKNADFISVAMKDFEIVLGQQKSVLKVLFLLGKYTDFMDAILLENIQRILKSQVYPLKIENLNTFSMDQNQLMSILPLIDSKTLSRIDIRNQEHILLEVDQLVKLDQWKNIKHMSLNCPVDYNYIQHFTHFSIDYIRFKTTHFPDMVSLKEMYLQSTGFQNIRIIITEKYDLKDVQRLLGEAYLDTNYRMRCFHRIPDTNQILDICVDNNDNSNHSIKLSRIEEGLVPREAVIQN